MPQSICEVLKHDTGNEGTAERRTRVGVGQAVVGFLAVLSILACAGDSGVIATYRGGMVTQDDLDDRVVVLPEAHRPPADSDGLLEWRRRLARQIMFERTLVPAEQFTPREGTILEPGPWRRELVRVLVEREGLRRVGVPEDSVVSRYERDWSRFFIPEGVAFQHVFLPVPSGADARQVEMVRALADSVHEAALSGTSFDELVAFYSRSESKQWGGRVGVVFRGQLSPDLERVLFSLNEGQVGGPVATEHGFHVVKVVERRPEEMKPLEEASPIIRHELLLERLTSMKDAYFQSLHEEFPIKVDADAYYESKADEAVVLEVGGETVTRGELAAWLGRLRRQPQDSDQLRQLLEGFGVDAQLYHKALALGLAEDPLAVGRYRAAAGRAFMDSLLTENVRGLVVEEEVLRSFYEDHPRRFSEPKRWGVREILFAPAEGKGYDAWQHAAGIAERAQSGSDFAALARQYSDAPSAEHGGDLGEMTLEETTRRGPEFQRCLFSLEEGEVSDVVRSGTGGYLILKLESVTEEQERPFEDVRESVRQDYVRKNEKELMEREAERLAAEAGFRFREEAL